MNNILIVGIARSGTTNLMKSLSSHYGYQSVFEPDYEVLKTMDIHRKVVKIIAGPWFPNDKLFEQYKRFDGVVLISRKDIRASAESLYVIRTYNNHIINRQWSNEYIPEDIHRELDAQLSSDKSLHEFAKMISEEVNYYEDVYRDKKLLNSNYGLDLEYLHERHKLRQPRTEKTII